MKPGGISHLECVLLPGPLDPWTPGAPHLLSLASGTSLEN